MAEQTIESLHSGVDEIKTDLRVHIAEENATFEKLKSKLETMDSKLDEHIEEHKEATRNTKRGIYGVVFTLLGLAMSALYEFLKNRLFPKG